MEPKTVVITGGSAGIGRATARRFARRGMRVAILARGIDRLKESANEIEALGGKALAIPTDVAYDDQVEAAASKVEEVFGPIHIWINNAMVSVFSPFIEIRPEEFRRVTEVTYLGYVYGTMAALRRMRPRDEGTIVQVGSALSRRSIPLQSAYCGAKHAIEGFTESIRSELIHDKSKIKITIVQLPAVNTPQFSWVKSRLPKKPMPVPPIFEPEVAARAIVWVTRHPRRMMNVGFAAAAASLAEKFIPGVIDRYLARAGYSDQQSQEPESKDRKHNLWRPVPGLQAARGKFSHRAFHRSMYLWLNTHRAAWISVFVAVVAAIFWVTLGSA